MIAPVMGPDFIGSVQVAPLAPQTTGTPPSDPALFYFLAFMQAFANVNARAAWGGVGLTPAALYPPPSNLATAVGYDGSPVFRTYLQDPQDCTFSEGSLPSLFAWRTTEDPEWPADGWRTQEVKASIRWVLPAKTSIDMKSRIHAFFSAFAKTFRVAMERGQDPSWVVAGDTDPSAASQGSVLVRWMCASGRWPWLAPWTRAQIYSGEQAYDAYATTLNFTERYVLNTGRQYDRVANPPTQPDQVTIHTPDGGFGDGGVVLGVENLKGPL